MKASKDSASVLSDVDSLADGYDKSKRLILIIVQRLMQVEEQIVLHGERKGKEGKLCTDRLKLVEKGLNKHLKIMKDVCAKKNTTSQR